ncbi:MAG: hypothetical protein ACFB0D_11560 [Phormidesmis sp.]
MCWRTDGLEDARPVLETDEAPGLATFREGCLLGNRELEDCELEDFGLEDFGLEGCEWGDCESLGDAAGRFGLAL